MFLNSNFLFKICDIITWHKILKDMQQKVFFLSPTLGHQFLAFGMFKPTTKAHQTHTYNQKEVTFVQLAAARNNTPKYLGGISEGGSLKRGHKGFQELRLVREGFQDGSQSEQRLTRVCHLGELLEQSVVLSSVHESLTSYYQISMSLALEHDELMLKKV